MNFLFDQTLTVISAASDEDDATPQMTVAGIMAAADATTIAALANAGVTVAMLAYTQVDPQVAVGDHISVGSASYPVVAPTQPYVSGAVGASIFITPCGLAAS